MTYKFWSNGSNTRAEENHTRTNFELKNGYARIRGAGGTPGFVRIGVDCATEIDGRRGVPKTAFVKYRQFNNAQLFTVDLYDGMDLLQSWTCPPDYALAVNGAVTTASLPVHSSNGPINGGLLFSFQLLLSAAADVVDIIGVGVEVDYS
jgi:hypothetical protein